MAEILSILSLVSYILAASFLILTVYLWFRFDIPKVYDDLTLKSAKKRIAQIHAGNEQAAEEKSDKKPQKPFMGKRAAANPETGLLAESSTADEEDSAATEMLTKPLEDTAATELMDLPTGLLGSDPEPQPAAPAKRTGGVELTLLEEVILVHTDERI